MGAGTCLVESYAARTNLTTLQNLTVVIGLSVISPIIIVLNLLLIIGLAKTKELRNAPGILLLLLSISDCLIGLVSIPIQIVLFTAFKTHPACTLEYMTHAVGHFTGHFSGYMIAVISFQRNVLINPNLKPRNCFSSFLVKKRGLMVLVAVTFVVTLAETIVSVIFYYEFIARLMLSILDSVIFAYVYVTYFWVYFKVWRFSKKITEKQTKKKTTIRAHEDRLAKTVALILIATAICYLPYQITVGMRWTKMRDRQKPSMELRFGIYLSLIVLYCNSAVNAAIIIWRSRKIRIYIRSIFKGISRGSHDRRGGGELQGLRF